MHLCCWFARNMSQLTRFCGVKFLAWKPGCVKFLTNSMCAPPPAYVSDLFVTPPRPFCAFCIYHPVVKVSLFQQYKQGGLQILVLSDRRNEFKLFKSICIICLTLPFVCFGALKPLSHLIILFLFGNIEICRLRQVQKIWKHQRQEKTMNAPVKVSN